MPMYLGRVVSIPKILILAASIISVKERLNIPKSCLLMDLIRKNFQKKAKNKPIAVPINTIPAPFAIEARFRSASVLIFSLSTDVLFKG